MYVDIHVNGEKIEALLGKELPIILWRYNGNKIEINDAERYWEGDNSKLQGFEHYGNDF